MSIKLDTALWMLAVSGGSSALCKTSSIEPVNLRILIRKARSCKESRSISGIGCSAMEVSKRAFVNMWKQIPSCTRPARPRRCKAFERAIQHSTSFDICLFSSKRISLCLPESITAVISGMVTPVSAIFVETTILRTPGGGTYRIGASVRLRLTDETDFRLTSKTRACCSLDIDECSGKIWKSLPPNIGCPSRRSQRDRMVSKEGRNTRIAAE